MTTRQQANDALMVFLSVLILPARIVEEGIHALAALPWAEVVSVRLNPRDGSAETVVQYRTNTPRWAIRLGYLAPEATAALAGLTVIAYWLTGGHVWWPASTMDWILLSLLGSQYLAVALPSAKDADQTPVGETQS